MKKVTYICDFCGKEVSICRHIELYKLLFGSKLMDSIVLMDICDNCLKDIVFKNVNSKKQLEIQKS